LSPAQPAEGGRTRRFGMGGGRRRTPEKVLPPHPERTPPPGPDGAILGRILPEPRRSPGAAEKRRTLMAAAPSRRVEHYLSELEGALRGLPAEQARDIVEEIRSHIRDSLSGAGGMSEEAVGRVLERLGSPSELAEMYQIHQMARVAVEGRGPWLALRTMVRWAGLSVKGLWVLLASLAGYGLSAA